MTREAKIRQLAHQLSILFKNGHHEDAVQLLGDISLMGMHADVLEFHEKFDVPHPETPMLPSYAQIAIRRMLLSQESKEVDDELDAAQEALIACGEVIDRELETKLVTKIVHECIDVVVVSLGTVAVCGVDPTQVWEAVQAANLAKAPNPNGGKILKPEGWQPADVESIIRKQMAQEVIEEGDPHAAQEQQSPPPPLVPPAGLVHDEPPARPD